MNKNLERKYFWYCNVCDAQNSREDGECQYCDCQGTDCKRDSCSDPKHFENDPDCLPEARPEARSLCPADNGVVKFGTIGGVEDAVGVCRSCSGIIGVKPIARWKALGLVNLNQMSGDNECGAARYFDLLIESGDVREPVCRVHGWIDAATTKVIQFG